MKYYDTKVIEILDGKNKTNRQNKTEIEQARIIKRTLGIKVASRYLYLRGWSIDSALYVLFGTVQRFEHLAFN
jgi:hypothetical protein